MQFDIGDIPKEHRCYQSDTGRFQNYPVGDCFFGVLANPLYGLLPMNSIPTQATGFHFYLGAEQQSLIDSYIDSEFPAQTKHLFVGNSSDNLGSGRDYSGLTASLTRNRFENLEVLELGVWQLFSNAHCSYGLVGSIDSLAEVMSDLRQLRLFGCCSLRAPVRFPKLEELMIIVDDEVTAMNGGPLDSLTVSNILSSDLPNLRNLYIDLDILDEDPLYSLPNSLIEKDLFPTLERVELVGNFRTGDKDRLLSSPSLRHAGQRIFLDEMRES